MKITSFQPMIVVPEANFAETAAFFEAMGFAPQHNKGDISGTTASDAIMKHEDGFKVDLVKSKVQTKALTTIRMNVDNLDEAIALFAANGFRNIDGQVHETESSKACMMVSPVGVTVSIVEHLK